MKKLFFAILVAFCIYVEDYMQRGAGMFIGMIIACVGLVIGDATERREKWRDYICTVGCILSFGFFIGIAMGIHIEETDDEVRVLSPFYTHVLECGERLETKQLNPYYTQYYSKYDLKTDTFYFIYKGDSCTIFNNYSKLLTIPLVFTIKQKDFGKGELDYIVVNDKTYDLRGREIKDLDGYKPYVLDQTPDLSSPLN